MCSDYCCNSQQVAAEGADSEVKEGLQNFLAQAGIQSSLMEEAGPQGVQIV